MVSVQLHGHIYMLRMDRLDQRMLYYPFARKSVHRWRKIFLDCLGCSTYCTLLTLMCLGNFYTRFRRKLVLALCDEQWSRTAHHHRHRQDQTLGRLRRTHFPETGLTRRDCHICSVRGTRRQCHILCKHAVTTHTCVLESVIQYTTHWQTYRQQYTYYHSV